MRRFVPLALIGLLPLFSCGAKDQQLVLEPIRGSGLLLPAKPDSVRFAVIGDSGTGELKQYQIGQLINDFHSRFPLGSGRQASPRRHPEDGAHRCGLRPGPALYAG